MNIKISLHRFCLFRLNPENSHQVPQAIVLCGPSRSGVFGLATARHLATLGVRTIVYVPDLPHFPENFTKEFTLYKLSGVKNWTKSAKGAVCAFRGLFAVVLRASVFPSRYRHNSVPFCTQF